MIVVTGASGFIGANLSKKLEELGKEVLRVDYSESIAGGCMEPISFLRQLRENKDFSEKIELVYHIGACSDTTCYDPFYMMKNNFNYSVALLNTCLNRHVRLIYASSAAIYGNGPFSEYSTTLRPKNLYAKSKSMFDEYVNCFLEEDKAPQLVGLRYFNVYGPGEEHKDKMASTIYQFFNQIKEGKKIKIFKNSENYLRDFIYIDDIINVNLHFLENKSITGIYNCGTAHPRSFCDIVDILKSHYDFKVEEVDMPESLKGKYQEYTCSNNHKLINEGRYKKDFLSLEEGIEQYLEYLEGA